MTFAVLAAGVAAYALLQSLVIPVLTTVQHELHTTQDAVTWVLTAYLLSASICTPILGRVGDMIGKERVFVVTLGALAAGSLLAAIAPSIAVMIVARVIQGVGGGMVPVAFGIIRDEFPAEKVAGAVGSLAALTAVGGGLGIVLAGPIDEALNYHWLFWLPDDPDHRGRDRRRCCSCPSRRSARRAGSAGRPPCCCRGGWSRCWSRSARPRAGAGARAG